MIHSGTDRRKTNSGGSQGSCVDPATESALGAPADGAVLALCAVSGVQPQSLTVDRQMRRYGVPRVAFVNKVDRDGADPLGVCEDLREKLGLNAWAVQLPVFVEHEFTGVIDLIEGRSVSFAGEFGEKIVYGEVPLDLEAEFRARRRELRDALAELDDRMADHYLNDSEPSAEEFREVIRRETIALRFVPVLMGSAYKNRGIQPLLDAVRDYLPSPLDREYSAFDQDASEAEVRLRADPDEPLVMLAFKTDETGYDRLTFTRIYQGSLKKSARILNVNRGREVRASRFARLHGGELFELDEAGPGDVIALLGIECVSGGIHAGLPPRF